MAIYKRGDIWIMRFKVAGQDFHTTTWEKDSQKALEVEEKAKDILRQVAKRQQRAQIHKPRRKKSLTFSEAIEKAYEERWKHTKSGGQVRYRLYNCLFVIGDLPLQEIDEYHLALVKAKMRSIGLTPASLNRVFAHLRTLFRMAKREWKDISDMPFIKIPKEKQHRLRVLSTKEERELLKTLREIGSDPRSYGKDIADLCAVLIDTGLRVGEALKLDYDANINFDEKVIELFPDMTKSGKPRNVPMTKRVERILKKRRKLH